MLPLKQRLTNAENAKARAEDAADTAIAVSLAVPDTAAEFMREVALPARLSVETHVAAYTLGRVALDFDHYIRRAMVHNVAEHVAQKMEIKYVGSSGKPWDYPPQHAYRGEVYVFTQRELEDTINDAMRAGRLTPE